MVHIPVLYCSLLKTCIHMFSISGMVTFSSPDPKYSHVFKGYTRFHQELGYIVNINLHAYQFKNTIPIKIHSFTTYFILNAFFKVLFKTKIGDVPWIYILNAFTLIYSGVTPADHFSFFCRSS